MTLASRCRRDRAPGPRSPTACPKGVVYTTFHHPVTGANVVTTEHSDWATNCPEYKVTAVQVRAPGARRAESPRVPPGPVHADVAALR